MNKFCAPAIMLLVFSIGTTSVRAQSGGLPPAPLDRTKVVILGVSHSAQLVAESYQPAVFRAFLDRLKPEAVCIERSPQEFARSDFYEFTYEAQFIAVPYARAHSISLCPIDWLPSAEDSLLAWGVADIEAPPFVRNPSGFQGFVNFDDPETLKLGLFYSESEEDRKPGREWAEKPAPEPRSDFARRLFLYRTFMQAMRIHAAAANDKGKTLLVVIGSMHNPRSRPDCCKRVLAFLPGSFPRKLRSANIKNCDSSRLRRDSPLLGLKIPTGSTRISILLAI